MQILAKYNFLYYNRNFGEYILCDGYKQKQDGQAMEYKGYKVEEKENSIEVQGVKDFNPVHVFECGQCFRWLKQEDGSYTGIVRDKVANVSFKEDRLIIKNASSNDFAELWHDYFDLDRDYGQIKRQLEAKDSIMQEAVRFGYGIRLLRQDLWETLVSFIISANNRIPRIMKTVAAIAKVYGDRLEFSGKDYYTFPGMDRLYNTELEKLEVCRGGFRCKYIVRTAGLALDGEIKLDGLKDMSTDEARAQLMKFPGVGPKVSDCVLLFSATKYDVFPTDVWVKRVMEELYFKKETSLKEIQEFSKEYFGDMVGFAQQYLFYYARENRIGV